MSEQKDRYGNDIGPALIQFYSWLRDTGELDRLIEAIIVEVRKDRERHECCKASAGLRT